MAAAEKHNRCVVDAGRFHYLVIDIPLDTICPRCDLIFNDTAQLNFRLPTSFIGDQCRNLCRCLWKRSLAKKSATDGEPHGQKGRRKHIKQQPGGTKDDVTMGDTSSGQKGSAKGASTSTDAKLHNAVLKTFCVLSQQVREVRGAVLMCWMIKQEAETERASLFPPRTAAFTGLLQALSERGSTVGAASAAGVENLEQTWDDLEAEGAFDLVPHCKLAKVYDPALSRLELVISVAQHREHIRGAFGQTGANRLLGQAPSGALERALSAEN